MADIDERLKGDMEYLERLTKPTGTFAPSSRERRVFADPDRLDSIRENIGKKLGEGKTSDVSDHIETTTAPTDG